MLKKQTVWLLTMLSLIVVLSVYALSAPDKPASSLTNQSKNQSQATAGKNGAAVTTSAADNKLGQIELDKADERSQLQKKYEGVIASQKSTAEQVSAAYDNMESMKTLANAEMMLEDVIQSKGYKNAVVKTAGSQVQIYVDAKNLTDQQANGIIRLANEYLGAGRVVSVSYNLSSK